MTVSRSVGLDGQLRMKTFRLLFKVSPEGCFGLPQDGITVIPGGREGVGPTLDSRSGIFVSHGTLSEYRPDDQAITIQLVAGDAKISVRDNFFTVEVSADSESLGLRHGTTAFEHFLRLLAVEHGDLFEYELLQIESDEGEVTVRPGPRFFQLARLTAYNTATPHREYRRSGATLCRRRWALDEIAPATMSTRGCSIGSVSLLVSSRRISPLS